MTHPNRWKIRPENEPILCDFTRCAHGMGQAGTGRCPGDWTKPGKDCSEFITQEEIDRQQEEE